MSAIKRHDYKGPVPWPYETIGGAEVGWIHTDTVEDEDLFEQWMQEIGEDITNRGIFERSKGPRRKPWRRLK